MSDVETSGGKGHAKLEAGNGKTGFRLNHQDDPKVRRINREQCGNQPENMKR